MGRTNLCTGRQLHAARVLAGLTQRDLASAVGVTERSVRRWEQHPDRKPVGKPNDLLIEEVLRQRGVLLIASPAPGCRMTE